jgi:predicted metalloprotease with PDZ domain
MDQLNIAYRVAFPNPGRHIYHVVLTIQNLPVGKHRLRLPVWTPGSYQVADFSGNLFGLEGEFERRPLLVTQTAKNRWDFETSVPGTVTIRYQVYAYQEGVRQSHLDQTHAYWNGAHLFLLVDDYQQVGLGIDIDVPPGWQVATGLSRLPDAPYRYQAANYDVLIDSPVEIGRHPSYHFDVDGKTHTIALWGQGNEDPDRLVKDVQRIVQTAREMFGELPYEHYTFIFHLSDHGTGGLEHLNSTTCGMERFSFRPEKSYRRVLSLIAHEFFHLWNVKRIHPEMLGPFDYDREVHTHLLWAMEGITDYYAGILLLRSGLYTLKDYLDRLKERIEAYEKRPGRFVQSLSQSSFETWTKFYRPGPDSPNRQISYYLKGELVGLLLDLEIRRRSQGQKSLDDVLRLLYQRYGRESIGFPEAVYQETVEEVCQSSFEEFFARYIESVDDLPLDQALASAGIEIRRQWKTLADDDAKDSASDTPIPWLGVDLKWTEHAYIDVTTSYSDGPAVDWLSPQDRIVALNGYALESPEDLTKRLQANHRPGDVVSLHLFRRGKLQQVTMALGQAPYDQISVIPAQNPNPDAKALLSSWLGVSPTA